VNLRVIIFFTRRKHEEPQRVTKVKSEKYFRVNLRTKKTGSHTTAACFSFFAVIAGLDPQSSV
jgi:hypothetical protein